MPEYSVPQRTCKACPDSLPGIATPGVCSSLLASRPCFLAPVPLPLHQNRPAPVSPAHGAYLEIAALQCLSGGSRCPEHISALKSPASERISVFYWVLCPFLGICGKGDLGVYLHVVVYVFLYTIRGSFTEGHPESRADW